MKTFLLNQAMLMQNFYGEYALLVIGGAFALPALVAALLTLKGIKK